MKPKITTFIILIGLISYSRAATTIRIKAGTNFGVTLQNQNGSPLTKGGASEGDGALLEFGYYSLATNTDPFSGDWNALTGPNSVSMISTTIGDTFQFGAGQFSFAFELSSTMAGLPVDQTPLAIRFYDSTTRENSTSFNAVAVNDGDWNWIVSMAPVQIDIGIGSQAALVWQGGPSSAQRTTLPIPEPSMPLLLLGSVACWSLGRKRK